VENPSDFGVVKCTNGVVTDFIEKPKQAVSNKAIIGIYYFKSGENFGENLQELMDNKVTVSGEYQLTTVLENMKGRECRFGVGAVDKWLDFGNKNACIVSQDELLKIKNFDNKIGDQQIESSVVEANRYVGSGSKIKNSVLSRNVGIGNNCVLENVNLRNCIIGNNVTLRNVVLSNTMISDNCTVKGTELELSLGAHTNVHL